jgi:hypothetical protein
LTVAGRLPLAWGATADELARSYPADRTLEGPVLAMTRAVDVAAPADLGWRWLCQIGVAPYSYDWIDNRGRRSPQELTPGADQLEVGQLMMIFRLTGFEPGRQWTGVTTRRASRLFGTVAVTYAVEPVGPDACRFVCRLVVGQRGAFERVRAAVLAWGDLVMMRRELLTLKSRAERDARRTR